jgi:hypothetical protein
MCKTYVGIDPGFTGAIGLIDGFGERIEAWDLPVIGGVGRDRQFDRPALRAMCHDLSLYDQDDLVIGLENPTSRPGEGGQRTHRFGEGIGMIKMGLECYDLPFQLVAPNLWKGRLDLPGKHIKGANKACAQFLVTHYPSAEHIVYGSRGGVKDGRLDALLIAHWLRTQPHDKD